MHHLTASNIMSRESLLSHTSSPSKKEITTMSGETIVSDPAFTKKAVTPSRKLQITAISAEDLVEGRKPVKKNALVALEMAGSYWKRPMVTSVDEVGGSYPMWNETLEAEMSTETKPSIMYVKVCCRNSSGKDTHVGTARVPVKDFNGEYAPEGFVHCLSYRLWDEFGRRNGVVNFSVRILPDKSGAVRTFWLR